MSLDPASQKVIRVLILRNRLTIKNEMYDRSTKTDVKRSINEAETGRKCLCDSSCCVLKIAAIRHAC